MSVPDVAVAGRRVANERSVFLWAMVVPFHSLLAALVSSRGLVAVTVAVLAIGPVAAGLMWTTIVERRGVVEARGGRLGGRGRVGMEHRARRERRAGRAGSTSRTVPPVAAGRPWLVTVRE